MIKASGGLTEGEIKRMVEDAEAHAEEDKKFHELVAARNKADATVHTIEKSLRDLGEKASEDDKKSTSEAIAAVKTAMAGDDREDIERKTDALQQAAAAIMQKSQQQSAAGSEGQSAGGEAGAGAEAKKDDVLDAEFEEVKESDRKKA